MNALDAGSWWNFPLALMSVLSKHYSGKPDVRCVWSDMSFFTLQFKFSALWSVCCLKDEEDMEARVTMFHEQFLCTVFHWICRPGFFKAIDLQDIPESQLWPATPESTPLQTPRNCGFMWVPAWCSVPLQALQVLASIARKVQGRCKGPKGGLSNSEVMMMPAPPISAFWDSKSFVTPR